MSANVTMSLAKGNAMFQYRVTKYNPAYRDVSGAYMADEWTARSDIGQSFGGVRLTPEAYQIVEDAYIVVAEALLEEAGVTELEVDRLNCPFREPPVSEGEQLSARHIGHVLRALLREEYSCRLVGADAFVHVGYDYYMYVGVPRVCPRAIATARDHNLYVEEFPSPWVDRED